MKRKNRLKRSARVQMLKDVNGRIHPALINRLHTARGYLVEMSEAMGCEDLFSAYERTQTHVEAARVIAAFSYGVAFGLAMGEDGQP